MAIATNLIINSQLYNSAAFAASDQLRAKTVSVAADRYTLSLPSIAPIMINGSPYYVAAGYLDLSVVGNWDTSGGQTASNRRGTDIYLYLCQPGSGQVATSVLSFNSTYPTGYTASNSRKYGCFHTLPVDVGTIAGHDLTGYLCGDIIPTSVKCLKHRPESVGFGEGMAELLRFSGPGLPNYWADIYMQSGTGTSSVSTWGSTVTASRNWMDFVDDLSSVGKLLLTDSLFSVMALGSPEQINIYGSQNPVKTGNIGTSAYTGSGLNDLTFSRAAWSNAAYNQHYQIQITASGTPDVFEWRQQTFGGAYGSYTTGVSIVAGAMSIADGLTITFAATTGHTVGNIWDIYIMDAPYSTGAVLMISHTGHFGCAGTFYQWLQDQSYRFDAAAAHTHTIATITGDPQSNVVTGNASADVAPAWQWVAPGGSKGNLYVQGTYGGVKLLAGNAWSYGSSCGSRSRSADGCRWAAVSWLGARGCARSRVFV